MSVGQVVWVEVIGEVCYPNLGDLVEGVAYPGRSVSASPVAIEHEDDSWNQSEKLALCGRKMGAK